MRLFFFLGIAIFKLKNLKQSHQTISSSAIVHLDLKCL